MLKQMQVTIALIILLITSSLSAQETVFMPSITVQGQLVDATHIVIDEIVADSFGFIVIRANDGQGRPGGVIGLALIHPGVNKNIRVELDMINVTPILFAVLHVDTEPFGNFQFGEVEGADSPVTVNDEPVLEAFVVAVLSVHDQFLDPDNFNRIVVDTASVGADAWVVVHADDNGELGAVLGHTFLQAGTTQNLPVLLQGAVTDTVHMTLHIDTGDPERFEFGDDSNADRMLRLSSTRVMTSFSTIPTLRVNNQLVIGSDLTRNDAEFVPFVIDSVLSDGAGWLVVHADNGQGQAGDILGFAPVQDGFNDNVIVEIPQAAITPQLFPMLHEDTGEALVYEFGTVEDADLPAMVNGTVIQGVATIIPSINATAILDGDTLTIESAIADTAAWLVLHDDNGDVLSFAPLNVGLNQDIQLTIDPDSLSEPLTLMLHYDSRPVGIFSFGEIDGSDLPVIFEGETIIADLILPEN